MNMGHNSQASASASATARTALAAEPSNGSAPATAGVAGIAGTRPSRPSRLANSAQSMNGSAQARVHNVHRPTGSPRRRSRASASTASSSGPNSSVATSRRTAHAGIVCRCTSTPVCRAPDTSGAESRASIAMSAPRPNSSMCSAVTLSRTDGPRSPLACTSTAGSPCGVERALLARGERKREMGELADHAGRARIGAELLGDRAGDRSLKLDRRRAEAVRIGHEERLALVRPRDVAKHEGRVERTAVVGDEVGRARIAAAAAARRYEDDSAPGLARGEHACKLDKRRRPGELGRRAPAGGVAVGDDHDRRGVRRARSLCDHRGERAFAVDRLAIEATSAHREAPAGRSAEAFELPRDVRGHGFIALASGAPVGKFAGQALRFGERTSAVERVRRERRGERQRARL